MALWKSNEVKVDIASYMHYIRGQKKVGKTSLFNDLVKYIGNGDMSKGLLISVGDEDGYKTLDGLMVATAPTWTEFVEIIDELVENRSDNDFKFIAIDTVDEVFNIGLEEVFRLHKKKYKESCESLNSALGGYGAGREKLKELVREQIARLKGSSYGLFCIGHTKIRDIKEKGKAEQYQQLTTSLNFDFDSVIADKADIIATISIDKDIIDLQTIETGKGKSKQVGSIGGVVRWIHFRDDNFNVDCGARFADITDKVELSAENYVKAIEDAIKAATHGKSDKEIEKMREKEVSERDTKAQEKLESTVLILPEENEELLVTIQSKFSKADKDTKVSIKEVMDEHSITSFSDQTVLPTLALRKIVELLG